MFGTFGLPRIGDTHDVSCKRHTCQIICVSSENAVNGRQ